MATTSWDQLKKVREEEFFQKEEREKIAELKAQREKSRAFMTETKDKMENFERGFSPLGGKSMFRAHVDGDIVLDCPEEGTVTLTYDVLERLLKESKNPDSTTCKKWRQFIEVAIDSRSNATPITGDDVAEDAS